MATRTRPPRHTPTVPLRCRKCGYTKIRVTRTQQMLRRTFRRDTEQHPHLHVAVQCMNCHREWWSAHETAIAIARELDAAEQDAKVIGPVVTRPDADLPHNKGLPLYRGGIRAD